ncbi:hypothetical protein HMPREF1581_01073 [Gardnerella vaginalis JCP8108]|uniref:Uncharacterized protein n=1 Tax=Gardnerella vaginalis JCP8108 TaxID=1261066 RepID=S4GVH1_GARVA|nr:hypothetical protein HMPREF1581_01073 [Gardnerella vaginalis JCP8108]
MFLFSRVCSQLWHFGKQKQEQRPAWCLKRSARAIYRLCSSNDIRQLVI